MARDATRINSRCPAAEVSITIPAGIVINRGDRPWRIIDDIDPKWSNPELTDRWFAACAKPGKGIVDDELRGILPELYAYFPQPGKAFKQEMPVLLGRGQNIGSHCHPQMTLIYYVQIGDPAPGIVIDGTEIQPERGSAVLIAPNTHHRVPRSLSMTNRLSIALRWCPDAG